MKCKHCDIEIVLTNGAWWQAHTTNSLCRYSVSGCHEPAEPVATAPEVSTISRCSMIAHVDHNLFQKQVMANFIRPASLAESMDVDKAAAPTNEPQKLCPTCKTQLVMDMDASIGAIEICPNCAYGKVGSTSPERDQSNIDNEKLLDDMIERLRPRPEMPPAEKRMICRACCTEVCSHGKCPNCHIRCKDCMEEELRAASVQQEPLSADLIIERLKSACNGHPNAKIPWPHRLLHDAIDLIERLKSQPAAPRTQGREPDWQSTNKEEPK